MRHRKGPGVIIVAIKRPTGDTRFNPTFRSAVKADDTLIALGEKSGLMKVEEMAWGKKVQAGRRKEKSIP